MDVGLAIRNLLRRPALTAMAVLTLSVGIGVNAVAFTLVNSLFFKGAAGRGVEGGGWITPTPAAEDGGVSLDEYARYSAATHGALAVAAEGRLAMAWRHEGGTDTAWVMMVSPGYLPMLGARPIVGRAHVAPGRQGAPAVVVGERFWRERLGGAPLTGLTLRLNGIDAAVSGVLPESFRGPGGLYSPDVWLPLDDLPAFGVAARFASPDARWLTMIGRIEAGATRAEIDARLAGAAAEMAREWPATHEGRSARFTPFSDRPAELRALATPAAAAMGAIGLVLLIACFNVANLLLARAVERERDMGIRAALGAPWWRQVRLVVAEGLVIAFLSGGVALVVAWWTQALVSAFAIPIEQPQHLDLSPDLTVVAFVAALVLLSGVLPGLPPAVSAARVNVARVLGSQGGQAIGGRPSRLGRWLVAAQVAGSTAFLVVAALFAQSYAGLASADLGFDTDRLVLAEFEPAAQGYDAERGERYTSALLARAAALPGITDVAVADRAPFFVGFDRMTAVSAAASPCEADRCSSVATLAVGPGYFRALGVRLAAGRELAAGRADEVVVNGPLARLLWPDGAGVGRTIRLGEAGRTATVVGITSMTRVRSLEGEPPVVYEPLERRHFEGPLTLVARTAPAPALLVRALHEAAAALDPNVPMLAVKTMDARLAVPLWPFRTVSWLFAICGALALVLATVGLAGVVAHAVGRRVREFGVRLSLGATPRDLAIDVLGGGARLLLPGLAAGSALAAAAAQLLPAALLGVSRLNPLTYVAVGLFQCGVVAAACLVPALRAARVDPLSALRSD